MMTGLAWGESVVCVTVGSMFARGPTPQHGRGSALPRPRACFSHSCLLYSTRIHGVFPEMVHFFAETHAALSIKVGPVYATRNPARYSVAVGGVSHVVGSLCGSDWFDCVPSVYTASSLLAISTSAVNSEQILFRPTSFSIFRGSVGVRLPRQAPFSALGTWNGNEHAERQGVVETTFDSNRKREQKGGKPANPGRRRTGWVVQFFIKTTKCQRLVQTEYFTTQGTGVNLQFLLEGRTPKRTPITPGTYCDLRNLHMRNLQTLPHRCLRGQRSKHDA